MEANDELTAAGKNLIKMITMVIETTYSNQFQFTISGLQKLRYSNLGVHWCPQLRSNEQGRNWDRRNVDSSIAKLFGKQITLPALHLCSAVWTTRILTMPSSLMKAQSGWCAMEKRKHLANLCLSKISFQVNIWSDISKWSATPSPHLNWYQEKRVLHRGDTGKSAVALYAEYVQRRRLSIASSRMTILNIKVSSLLFLFFLVTQQHSFLKTKPFVLFQYKL